MSELFRLDGITTFVLAIFALLSVVAATMALWEVAKKKNLSAVMTISIGVVFAVFILGLGAVAANPDFARRLVAAIFNV